MDDVIDLFMVDDELLLELLSLLDDVLVDIVKEYFLVVKKFDFEDVGDVGVDVFGLLGVFLVWFDIIKDGFCVGKDFIFKKFVIVVFEMFCEGIVENVFNVVEFLLKSRKVCKFVFKD